MRRWAFYALLAALCCVPGCAAMRSFLEGVAGAPDGSGGADGGVAHGIGAAVRSFGPEGVGLIAGGALAAWKLVEGLGTRDGREKAKIAFTRKGGWRGTVLALVALTFGKAAPVVEKPTTPTP